MMSRGCGRRVFGHLKERREVDVWTYTTLISGCEQWDEWEAAGGQHSEPLHSPAPLGMCACAIAARASRSTRPGAQNCRSRLSARGYLYRGGYHSRYLLVRLNERIIFKSG